MPLVNHVIPNTRGEVSCDIWISKKLVYKNFDLKMFMLEERRKQRRSGKMKWIIRNEKYAG